MKSLCLLLLMLVNVCQGQHKKNHKWERMALMTGSIMLSAVGDGLQDQGNHKELAHGLKGASALCLLSIPLVSHVHKKKAFKYVLSYTLMRYGIFDAFYNKSRGLPLDYVGSTSLHDKIIGGMPGPMLFATKASAIWISIELNNREVK